MDLNLPEKEIRIQVKKIPFSAKKRKLDVAWTLEAAAALDDLDDIIDLLGDILDGFDFT